MNVTASKSPLRRLATALGLLLLGAIIGAVLVFVSTSNRGGELEPWHLIRPAGELVAGSADAPRDLDAYLELEERLFAEVATELERRVDEFPAFSRFDPLSPTHPSRFERDWNRTWELYPDGRVAGEALLLHGLSDSPYSLRAVGQLLADEGFHVVGLRTPGHGTTPGGLAAATREDWRAAVRLGVAATGDRAAEAGVPFVMVGYSNGSALALDYTSSTIASGNGNGNGSVPDRLIFLSPAFAVSPMAAVAPWLQRASRIPGLAGLGWESIHEEFDPFKFNSFPVHAGAEIYSLTSEIEDNLVRMDEEGKSLPPLLALQSVVDATIPPVASLTRLFRRVRLPADDRTESESELVLFDANRAAGIGELLGPQADELLALALPRKTFPFRISLITNADDGTRQVVEHTRPPNELEAVPTPLDLEWPPEVFSLSHVAIPFRPDDPAYGVGASSLGPPFPFGDLELKGERGVFRIPDSLLTRLRYNPFFEVVEAKIVEFVLLPRAFS